MTLRHAISPERLAKDQAAQARLNLQRASLLAGSAQATRRAELPVAPAARAPVDRLEAIKALGLYRKSVRMRPVISGYTPKKTWTPVVFPYRAGQHLTRLSRDVCREWVQVLTGVSGTSLAGGRLDGSQGRNLIRVVEELRKHCYLKLDDDGSPAQVREQVVQVVDGGQFCFARECGMSASTFYRALRHPLAHLFVRTQKVQRIEADSEARRNCATLFSVALFEPVMPEDLEAAYWSEQVELAGEFVVPDFTCQADGTKGRPLTTQKQNAACGKLTTYLQGASANAYEGQAREDFLRWIDSAALLTRAGHQNPVDLGESGIGGCIDRLRTLNPGLWEYAVQIAIHHDAPESHAVAAVGYYKALIHVGVERVRYWVQRLEKWRLKGQEIETPGKLLTHHLNREARAATGFNLRDLGTEVEHMLS